jgi:protein O-GlcNAc transferase
VITLAGDRHVQRTTYSLLKHLEVEETIAHSEEEYVESAAALITSPALLKKTKRKLAEAFQRVLRSQAKEYTMELEQVYRVMWERYRKNEPVSNIFCNRSAL